MMQFQYGNKKLRGNYHVVHFKLSPQTPVLKFTNSNYSHLLFDEIFDQNKASLKKEKKTANV